MYIITYDIKEDKKRRKVSKILEDYGTRVQYSVFECDITQQQADNIICRFQGLIDIETDSIIVYFYCANCRQKEITIGKKKEKNELTNMFFNLLDGIKETIKKFFANP
jgi:CRISPR-associated protein Cas2